VGYDTPVTWALVFLKRNSRGNPTVVYIFYRRKQNKIENVQIPRRATTAQECPHRREKVTLVLVPQQHKCSGFYLDYNRMAC